MEKGRRKGQIKPNGCLFGNRLALSCFFSDAYDNNVRFTAGHFKCSSPVSSRHRQINPRLRERNSGRNRKKRIPMPLHTVVIRMRSISTVRTAAGAWTSDAPALFSFADRIEKCQRHQTDDDAADNPCCHKITFPFQVGSVRIDYALILRLVAYSSLPGL